jgi:hypothetical protein
VLGAAAPNTYVHTWEGWLYLATVIDCYSRKIVGWAMDDNYKTPLIQTAIRMAARNVSLPEGAIFHSDRGSNYTSEAFADTLSELGLRQSMGRTGICYDSSLAESTNGALKVELVNREEYPTRAYAMKAISRYIELFYNTRRLHSTLGYQTHRKSWTSTTRHQQQPEKSNNQVPGKNAAAHSLPAAGHAKPFHFGVGPSVSVEHRQARSDCLHRDHAGRVSGVVAVHGPHGVGSVVAAARPGRVKGLLRGPMLYPCSSARTNR